MKSKLQNHTPGPWKSDEWAPGYSVSAPDSQYTICNLSDCNNAEANANLIAAAPELLEACQLMQELLETRGEYPNLQKLIAATILKATEGK